MDNVKFRGRTDIDWLAVLTVVMTVGVSHMFEIIGGIKVAYELLSRKNEQL